MSFSLFGLEEVDPLGLLKRLACTCIDGRLETDVEGDWTRAFLQASTRLLDTLLVFRCSFPILFGQPAILCV